MKEVYFDNGATTRCYPEVANLIRHLMLEDYGNPSSLHQKGVDAEKYIREAADRLAKILRVERKEIYFTSGGTESNNWALFGIARAAKRRGRHIIISSVEHPAVSSPAEALEEEGYEVTRLPVDRFGRVDPEKVREAIRPDTILVSVMMVNNEIGTIEPIQKIGAVVKEVNPGICFHVDAIQAFGKMEIHPKKLKIDLLSASGHKIHGPKGVGFLYINQKIRIKPLIYGGGQQNQMRSGTDNVPGIAGFGLAASMVYERLTENTARMTALKERLYEGVKQIEGTVIHGEDFHKTAPHIINVSFTGIRSEVLLHTLEEQQIYVSAGSACSSHKRSGSPTLTAIGCSKGEMESAVRFSFSEYNTEEEVDYTLQALKKAAPMLRRFMRK